MHLAPSASPFSSALRRSLLSLALLLAGAAVLPGQGPPDQAVMLLTSARRAFNEKNYPFAADRFREFLAKYGGHKDAPAARYGLALCFLEGPTRDHDKAVENLQPLAGAKDFSDHPFVLYYLALARRGQGVKALDLASSQPAQAAAHRNTASQRFEEASRQFAAAAAAFAARAKEVKTPPKGGPIEAEWAARARCDEAEMLLRLRKAKEARAAVTPFVEDKALIGSRYRPLGLYYHGFANFLLGDHFEAGKSLSLLSPFKDPVFGTHARYLLARVHHLNTAQDEREEARLHYKGVLADHEVQKKAAQAALAQPAKFGNDPEERARLERLVRGPAPDHVARAHFFLGVMQYEDGRHAEALEHFKTFLTQHPTSSVAVEARLRQGFCLVQLKQYGEAIKVLQPLADKEPLLADQALYWIGKAQLGTADPRNPGSYTAGLATLRSAAEKAGQRASATPPDPRAKGRRGEVLLDLAEAQQSARQYREAAATCGTVLNDKLLPGREDEVLLVQATALQLAGDPNESDKVCDRFKTACARSTLLPSILFRSAENAYFRARAAEKLPNPAQRAKETAAHYEEAIKRYTLVVEKYPEFSHVNLARYGLGVAYLHKGDIDKARSAFESIPAAERTGELVVVSLQLAEILIRQAPARADDAVAAGKLEEAMKTTSELLESFVGAAPDNPAVPDALLKLGYCQQRTAKLLAQQAERDKAVAAARAAYERLLQKYPSHPARAQAAFERAKCLALARDANGAVNELRKFAQEPLRKAPIAPMALLHLSTLLRSQNKAAEAVQVLEQCRKDHESALSGDASRSAWVPLLQYHHAVALREAGRLAEARALFETVAKVAADKVEGWEAVLRAGQAQKEAGEKKLAEAARGLNSPNPQERDKAQKLAAEGAQDLQNAATYLASQADALKTRKPASEEQAAALAKARSRMLYESAWAWRTLADRQVKEARHKVQIDLWQKKRDELTKKVPPGQPVPNVAMPEVPLSSVPLQPAEQQVRARYKALIESFPDVAINADARFELAELLSQRGENDQAVKLLEEALEKEPPADLTEKIKVRLGTALLDRGVRKTLAAQKTLARTGLKPQEKETAQKQLEAGKADLQSALEQIQPVAENPKSPVVAQAVYREAECLLQLGKRDEAVKLLVKFRDQDPFRNAPGLADRALLRLGMALGEAKQWEASRQAYEALVGRFPASPWVHKARYGMGWARQNQGQYDEAVNQYTQVVNATASELGARAQLNIGLCRLAQKRYAEATTALLVVPFTYDYPDLSALALLEAARAFAENKQSDQAVKLLRRVMRDHPDSEHAEAARKRLAAMGEG